MGLSIHYNGKFRDGASFSKMIDEIKDIVEICKWEYIIYNSRFPENKKQHDGKIYGISFTPPGCETVSISFLSNRRMSGSANLMLYGGGDRKINNDYLYMLSVKTQFAGIEIHKFIIQLFRYLKKQDYFDEFNLIDEGKYWETGDEKLLEDTFKTYTELLDSFSFAIESVPVEENESFEKYFERLMNMINRRNRNRLSK